MSLPQHVNDELQRIFDERGRLVAEDIVEIAADPASPLHDHFTWDDTEAAAKWRHVEAGILVRKGQIVMVKDADTEVKVRAYVSVVHAGERTYMPTERALAEHRDQLIQQALRDVNAMRRRYQALVDFDEVLRMAISEAA